MTLYDEMRSTRYRSGVKAVQDQKAVGALGGSLKANPEVESVFKEWTTDQDIDDPSKTIPGTKRTYKDPKGTLQEGGRIEREEQEWGKGGQRKASDQLKIYNKSKKGNKLTADKIIKGAGYLQDIAKGAQQAFGEGDIIFTGEGHGGRNPFNEEMLIGSGVGY